MAIASDHNSSQAEPLQSPPSSDTPILGIRAQPSVVLYATAGAFILLILIILISIYFFLKTREYSENALKTQIIITEISRVGAFAREAESGQRGFLLVGESRYLDAFYRAQEKLPNVSAKLDADLSDDPAAQAEARQLNHLVQQKLAELKETIDLKTRGQSDDALAIVKTDRGLNIMKAISATTARMIASQQQILTDRFSNSQATARLSVAVSIIASVLIVVFAWISVRSTSQLLDALRSSQTELASANNSLEETVTERTADLNEANEELQRYAYIVSHDLRSPLVNVMGFTSEVEALKGDAIEMLEQSRSGQSVTHEAVQRLGSDFDEAIGFIKNSIDKMERLIAAILKLAREGRRTFAKDELNMSQIIRNIVDGEAHRSAEIGAEIVVGTLPPFVGDRLAIEQVFGNLVDNALKYLKPGRPGKIEITGRRGKRAIIYQISDNGRGIDQRDHQRIFELFRRSGNQNVAGEGIGLAHVRSIVRALGGIITCDSELDRGTTFTLRFPTRT